MPPFVKARDVSAHELTNDDLHAFADREGFDKILTADVNMTSKPSHGCPLWFTTYAAE